jgi:hypothetical protein
MGKVHTSNGHTDHHDTDSTIGTFRPAHRKPKKPIPFSIKQIDGTGVGAEVKKISREDLFSAHKNRFEKAFIDSLVKKNFAPEQIIRILEIFQDHEEDRMAIAKEKNPVLFAEIEYRRLGISLPAAPTLRPHKSSGRKKIPKMIHLVSEDIVREVPKKITLNDIRTGRYKKIVRADSSEAVATTSEVTEDLREATPSVGTTESRLEEISPLFARLEELYGDNILKYAGPISTSVQEKKKVSAQPFATQSFVELVRKPNWRSHARITDSEHISEILHALETIGNEDVFFSRFVSTYIAGNPSALENVKGWNAYDVLHIEVFAPLDTHEKRHEVSALLLAMETIAKTIRPTFVLTKDSTIRELYDTVRMLIIEGDRGSH